MEVVRVRQMNKIFLLIGTLFLASSYVEADGNFLITWTVIVHNKSDKEIQVGGTVWDGSKEIGHCWDLSPDPGYDNQLWTKVSLGSNQSITRTTKEIPGRDSNDCEVSYGGEKYMAFSIDSKVIVLKAEYSDSEKKSQWLVYIREPDGSLTQLGFENMGGSYHMPFRPTVKITYRGPNDISADIDRSSK